jgi:Tol biopolymer transport system component
VPLAPGTRLGSYEVLGSLGAGGMGEVYRARDAKLQREVAIKVLSSQLATDPGALARFEREALSVASLSHPNILAIYELAHDAGSLYLVTELVDGETLRERLSAGPLAQRRAIAYAQQIARGIAAAHARGIVHRDLKPENVMITRDDQVKILDFGLAKPISHGATELAQTATINTTAGTILGTFGYMAPEQIRGLTIDHRADIFAFGAVLYEMLSGERAFKGETAADTMTAVLTREPAELDLARLSISPSLDRLIRHCLEKSPDLRFQSGSDLAFALESLSTASVASAAHDVIVPRARPRLTWIPWVVAGTAVAAAAAAWLFLARPTPEARWAYFTRITEAAGEETAPALSPDGATVVYSMRANGSWGIYAQRAGGRNATAIVDDPQMDEGGPAFSPDGSSIAFHHSNAAGGIFVAGATGESVRRVTDFGFEPAWSPDGTQLAFATEEITDPASRLGESRVYVVALSGGAPRKLFDGDAVQPSWSPSGKRIVYWSNIGGQRDIYTVSSSGGAPVAITHDAAIDWSPVWSPDGRFIYFSSDRGAAMNLWRVAVDEASGRPIGPPEPVTTGVQATAALPRFSKDGSRLAFRSRIASVNPVAIPFDPVTLRAGEPRLLDTQNNIRVPSGVSPDGTQLAYFSIGEHQEDLFVGPPGGAMRRVTDDPPRDRAPQFMPDGRSLIFYSARDGNWAAWIVGVDGGGLRKLFDGPKGVVYIYLSPKGDRATFVGTDVHTDYMIPIPPGAQSRPAELSGTLVDGRYFSVTGWSRDATRLVGTLASESNRPAGVATYDLQTHTTTAVSSDETYDVRPLADGRHVLYFTNNGAALVALDVVTRVRTVVNVRLPGPSIADVFAMSPDDRTIYYGASRAEADIWIVERK